MEDPGHILDYEDKHLDPDLYLADTGRRLANYIIDQVGFYIYLIAIIMLFEMEWVKLEESNEFLPFLFIPLTLSIMLSYWVLFEYFFGKTPAKFLTRTKVVTRTGGRPTFWTILARTLCRFIPLEPFSFFGAKPIGWHDSISKTLVVIDEYNAEGDYV